MAKQRTGAGRPKKYEDGTERVSMRMPGSLVDQARAYATSHALSLSEAISQLIELGLASRKKKPQPAQSEVQCLECGHTWVSRATTARCSRCKSTKVSTKT